MCGGRTRLLYPSTVVPGEAIRAEEVACTSPHLGLHDDIFTCRRCGLARSVPPAGVEALYRQVEDPEYLASEKERRASFRRAARVIERYRRPGRLLEIGSAVGLFLDAARERGWEVTGIEPSRWAAEEARRRGLETYPGTLAEFDPAGRAFDAVVLWDVLEHLVDPVAEIRRIRDLLLPGGILGLTTVNIAGTGARLFRGRWPWLMRMHLHYFTPRSLAAMVRREGLDVLRLTTEPKVLRLGYVLDRARGMFGPVATTGRWIADHLRLSDLPVRINLGDIILLIARRLTTGPP